MGMDKDLDLNSAVYNWAITMFFIGYVMLVSHYSYIHKIYFYCCKPQSYILQPIADLSIHLYLKPSSSW